MDRNVVARAGDQDLYAWVQAMQNQNNNAAENDDPHMKI